MSCLQDLIDQLNSVHGYTSKLLENIPEENWFRMPGDGVTHIAGQISLIRRLWGNEP